MSGLWGVIFIGVVLGMRHATDADHVIAVTTIVSRERRVGKAALVGVLWGIGHSLTICLVGGLIIAFNWIVPARIGLLMELAVGLMLILLGVLNLTGVLERLGLRTKPAYHADAAGLWGHSHLHSRRPAPDSSRSAESDSAGWLDACLGNLSFYQAVRPLVVGIVHGLAGSAAVALLVLATIENRYWAISYLFVFGAGTVIGMMGITAAIALPIAYTARKVGRVNRGLVVASGLISFCFGLLIVYQFGVVGLLNNRPTAPLR
jgi:hypothetical protein